MTNKWASNWRETSLRHAEVEVTQFAKDVLAAWQRSTPTEPWTNNPLGIPAKGYGAPRALNTPYAAFPTIQAFRDAFRRAVHSHAGKPLLDALMSEGEHGKAWRTISALGWPASDTESEYPSGVLDLAEGKYTDSLKPKVERKNQSAGSQLKHSDIPEVFKAQARHLHRATTDLGFSAAALRQVIQRSNGHG